MKQSSAGREREKKRYMTYRLIQTMRIEAELHTSTAVKMRVTSPVGGGLKGAGNTLCDKAFGSTWNRCSSESRPIGEMKDHYTGRKREQRKREERKHGALEGRKETKKGVRERSCERE